MKVAPIDRSDYGNWYYLVRPRRYTAVPDQVLRIWATRIPLVLPPFRATSAGFLIKILARATGTYRCAVLVSRIGATATMACTLKVAETAAAYYGPPVKNDQRYAGPHYHRSKMAAGKPT
jgi:hypothetical protein